MYDEQILWALSGNKMHVQRTNANEDTMKSYGDTMRIRRTNPMWGQNACTNDQ